jgi:hypothetical protein
VARAKAKAKAKAIVITISHSHPVFLTGEAATLPAGTPVALAISLRGPRTRSYPEVPLT